MWQDSLRVKRLARRMKPYRRVQQLIEGCGLEPREIAEKIWQPVLQHASLETDDDLQERWAALLANASLTPDAVHPGFVDILGSLDHNDAMVLDHLYVVARKWKSEHDADSMADTETALTSLSFGNEYDISKRISRLLKSTAKPLQILDNLVRLRLLARPVRRRFPRQQ
jgi:hypothetical protein